jgi:hypothetical protein
MNVRQKVEYFNWKRVRLTAQTLSASMRPKSHPMCEIYWKHLRYSDIAKNSDGELSAHRINKAKTKASSLVYFTYILYIVNLAFSRLQI